MQPNASKFCVRNFLGCQCQQVANLIDLSRLVIDLSGWQLVRQVECRKWPGLQQDWCQVLYNFNCFVGYYL